MEYDMVSDELIDYGNPTQHESFAQSQAYVQMHQRLYFLRDDRKLMVFDMQKKSYSAYSTALSDDENFWKDRPCLVSTSTHIVVIGGYIWPNSTNQVWSFNIIDENWDNLYKSMSIERHQHSCAFVPATNSIYAVGGYKWNRLDSIEKLVITNSSNEWSLLSDTLPMGIVGSRSLLYGDKIYIIGGVSIGVLVSVDTVCSLNTKTDKINVETAMQMPFKAGYQGCAITKEPNPMEILCAGGYDGIYSIYDAIIQYIAPTNSPSNAPSIAPTTPPSAAPSNNPSFSPSNAPTSPPTSAPTTHCPALFVTINDDNFGSAAVNFEGLYTSNGWLNGKPNWNVPQMPNDKNIQFDGYKWRINGANSSDYLYHCDAVHLTAITDPWTYSLSWQKFNVSIKCILTESPTGNPTLEPSNAPSFSPSTVSSTSPSFLPSRSTILTFVLVWFAFICVVLIFCVMHWKKQVSKAVNHPGSADTNDMDVCSDYGKAIEPQTIRPVTLYIEGNENEFADVDLQKMRSDCSELMYSSPKQHITTKGELSDDSIVDDGDTKGTAFV